MAKIKTVGMMSHLDDSDYDDGNWVTVVIDTDDVLYAQPDEDDPNCSLLVMKDRKLTVFIKMDIDTYAAIACVGFEHLSTYGQIVGQ